MDNKKYSVKNIQWVEVQLVAFVDPYYKILFELDYEEKNGNGTYASTNGILYNYVFYMMKSLCVKPTSKWRRRWIYNRHCIHIYIYFNPAVSS